MKAAIDRARKLPPDKPATDSIIGIVTWYVLDKNQVS